MNDTLDVLRYWLPEWEFEDTSDGLKFWDEEGNPLEDRFNHDTDYLAASLRRKYLEREEVWKLELEYNRALRYLVRVYDSPEHLIAFGQDDTELLATIEAGRMLRQALEASNG